MLLRSRFGLEANFDEPKVVYKETPAKEIEGYIRYTMQTMLGRFTIQS